VAAVRAGENDPLVEHMIEALRNAAHRLAHGPVAAVA
jgi:hypothetical protein